MGFNNETFQLKVSEVDGEPTELAVRHLVFPNDSLTISDAGEVQIAFVVGVGGSITLSGDVTGTGTGTISSTIANDAVTFAKMQNVSTNSLLGRFNSGTGNVEQITVGNGLSLGASLEVTPDLELDSLSILNPASLNLIDNASSQFLTLAVGEALTAGRTISILTGDADRSLTLTGNASIEGTNTGDGAYITPLTEEATIASGDFIAIYDVSASAYRKMTRANFTAGLSTSIADGDKGDIIVSGSGATWTIDNDAVTFPKMQNIATDRLLGRFSASSGNIEEIQIESNLQIVSGVLGVNTGAAFSFTDAVEVHYGGFALVDSDSSNTLTLRPDANLTANRTLDIITGDADRTLTLTGNASISGTHSGTSSGTNTGDQTITLTGDVTGSGTGSFATTIPADSIDFAQIQNIATNTLLGRSTAGTGDVEQIAVNETVAGIGRLLLDTGTLAFVVASDPELETLLISTNTGLSVVDTDGSHALTLKPGSDLTAARTLAFATGDADRTITLSGNPTLSDWFDQSVKVAATPKFAKLFINTTETSATFEIASATSGSQDLGRFAAYGNNAFGPIVRYRKARGTEASKLIVANNDIVGEFPSQAWDGDQWLNIADLSMEVDGTPADNNVPGRLVFYTSAASSIVERMRITSVGNVKIGGTVNRGTTEGTKHLDIFDGTAPVGTLANGISLYSTAGELRVMDSAGNATLLSPHDKTDNAWIYHSRDINGRVLKIEVEKMLRFLNDKFKTDFIHEFTEAI